MKKIEVKYNTDGYIESVSDNAVHFEQENDSLVVIAKITTNKKVRAYIRAANNNSTVTDELTPADGVYSCVVDSDYMAKGTLYMGFELYDNSGYTERLEPLKIYIDSFVNLGGGSSDNVYVVTLKVGKVETLANGMPATVENVGTKKDMILNFGLPRGEQGIKGDKGEKGDTGAQGIQGIQGIQGVQGKDGYTPVKGVDYFTPADIASLGIDAKADKTDVEQLADELNSQIDNNVGQLFDAISEKADTSNVNKKFDNITNALNTKADSSLAFDGIITIQGNPLETDELNNLYGKGIYKVLYSVGTHDVAGILEVGEDSYTTDEYEEYWETQKFTNYNNECYIRNSVQDTIHDWYEWKKVSVSQDDIKGFATKKELADVIGDIETSLDNIIAMQNSLIPPTQVTPSQETGGDTE